jgi:hypothetical protein
MFRHHHVADQRELVTFPHFVENLQENVALPRCARQGTSPVTTTSDEMQMPLPITPLQSILQHSHSFKTRTLCQPRKECGTRKGRFQATNNGKSLQRQLPQWYHPPSSWVKKKKMHSGAKGWATRLLRWTPSRQRLPQLHHLRLVARRCLMWLSMSNAL